jgi:hypothetical protein
VDYKANAFLKHIHETHRLLRFCRTNAHHQNGVAERAIQSISNMARAMILHAIIHWKDGVGASLWPQSVTYATNTYNKTPKYGVCPADIFTGSAVSRHRLIDLHVWGCPLYVLDPKIQPAKSFLGGNLVPGESSFWESVNNMQVKFMWCSTLALEVLPLSFMWCLMIY